MKLREIFRYEVGYRLRSVSTWVYFGFLFLAAVWMYLFAAEDAGAVHANAPEAFVWGGVRAGMLGILVTAALFGDAAVRDVRARMDALVYSSPVGKGAYLGGRFLGALAVNAILLVAIPLGTVAGTAVIAHFEPELLGPFRLAAVVQPYFVFLVPNVVLVGAIVFAAAVLTRHVVPAYLAALALFIGSISALNYAGQIDNPLLLTLADPFGLATLQEATRYATAIERNTRLVGLPAALALNRAVMLALAAAVLALLHRTFRFAHAGAGAGRRRGRRIVSAPVVRAAAPVAVPRVAGSFGFRTAVRQTFAVARNSLAGMAGSRWFGVVLLACVGLPLLWGWNVGSTVFDTSTWPVTLLVTEVVLATRSVVLFIVLVMLFAGELVWKEREVGMAEIEDAAPVPDGVALLGRFLALVAMIVMFQAAAMAGGLLIQTLQGYTDFDLTLYLQVVFGLKLADYVLLAALAMTLHVLVDHKNLGHLAVVMALLLIALAPGLFGLRHHLLLYNTAPGWDYSDMNGFGPFAAPLVWFKLYWAAWALLLLVLALLFRARGREPGLRSRLRQAARRFAGPVVRAAGLAAALILVLGGFIFYNTNVLNDYHWGDDRGRPQAEYEKRFGRYEGLPQPTITRADLRVEIHPDEPAVEIRGSYLLVNRTDHPIDSVHVSVRPDVEARSITVDGTAEAAVLDEEVGYRIYALPRTLRPGDFVRLAFDAAYRPRGFPNDGIQTAVVANGTSFNRMLMPFVGYQPLFELSNPDDRARHELPAREPLPGPEDGGAAERRWLVTDADLVHVDAVIGTAADQVAVTPGALRRSWSEDGRRYFHYETEVPIAFGFSVFSAEYEVVEDRWNDVTLRILHHPEHDDNVDRVLHGMKAALDYMTGQFGAYPYGELSIVEIPRYGDFGSAHPYVIAFSEAAFFSRVEGGQVDQPFYGTAHEVAHTWWGGLVRGAPVLGAGFLSESLANYSATMVTEKAYGRQAGRQVYGFHMERYLRGRAELFGEVPLLRVGTQPYVAYRKGPLAMYTLREHIGEEAVNGTLRRYFERYRDAGPPHPTSLDLYDELRAATPDSLHFVLTDWFETITLWDFRTERATVEPGGSGDYVVTLEVVARKMRADGRGHETEVPMDDLVEIGVFGRGEGGGGQGEPLYLERHRIRTGPQTIRITVAREPARAGIDPYRMLIDRQRDDNVKALEMEN